MLTELIDKIDNNSELLMCLAKQLGSLTPIFQPHQVLCLCKPLEIIAASDESVVREKSVQSLLQACQAMDVPSFEGEFLPLLERLVKGDNYSMRISASAMISRAYQRTNSEAGRENLK